MRPVKGSLYDCTVLEGSHILDKMTEIYVKITPDSKEIDVDASSHIIEVNLTEKAENQRANSQLLQLIKERTGEKASLKKGHKSRRKKIRTDLDEEEFKERMEE